MIRACGGADPEPPASLAEARPPGENRSAWSGMRSTSWRLAETIPTVAVIPGFSRNRGFATLTTASYVTTFCTTCGACRTCTTLP
jgi:hypothetical protein